jgi:hypothetical protein
MELTIDVNDLTLGEVEFFETESGLSFDELAAGRTNTRAIIALVTITERRRNPDYTADDARKVKLGDITVKGPDEDPTKPAKARARSSK